jgi:hypothetical protein
VSRLAAAGPWEAIIDTSSFVPQETLAVAQTLEHVVGRYVLMSTVSVHEGWPTEPLAEIPPSWGGPVVDLYHLDRYSASIVLSAATGSPNPLPAPSKAAGTYPRLGDTGAQPPDPAYDTSRPASPPDHRWPDLS